MGKQDMLSVIACGQAIKSGGICPELLQERAGLFLSVGYIPFEREDVDELTRSSMQEGEFSMESFSRNALYQTNPLLTFRCLPNMPIFHTSLNFKIQGPYFISYPGIGQFYLALEQALMHLESGLVDLALVGGIADQDNFLVSHHFSRQGSKQNLVCRDAAGFFCLEKSSPAKKRGATILSELVSYSIGYNAVDFTEKPFQREESFWLDGVVSENGREYLGPGSLPVVMESAMEKRQRGDFIHQVSTPDGFTLRSEWRLA